MPVPPPKNGCIHDENEDTTRCWWCGDDPGYTAYHDEEWGRPISDDHRLFEKIVLEGFQAGLSWLTILRKRDEFRNSFHGFDFHRISRMRSTSVERLLKNPGIVRHRGKIESTINNAKKAVEILESHETLSDFFWEFRPEKRKPLRRHADLVPHSPESNAMSKELKRLGWSFVGPTTCYAFMQAMGLVNDHFVDCDQWERIETLQIAKRNALNKGNPNNQ